MGIVGRLRDDRGVTGVEIAIIIAGVALVVLPAIFAIGSALSGSYQSGTAADPGVCTGAECDAIAEVPQTGVVLVNSDGGSTQQTISFAAPATGVVGGTASLSPTTTASGLSVTLTVGSSSSGVCFLTGFPPAYTVTYVSAGTCTITATQSGNSTYAAATPLVRSIAVSANGLLAQFITFTAPANGSVGGSDALTPTTTASGLVVLLSVSTSTATVCSLSGTAPNYTVNYLTTGTCRITASQPGNTTYAPATPVTRTITVGKRSQTITFTPPSTGAVGGSAAVSASTTATGLVVTLTVDAPSSTVCSLTGTAPNYTVAYAASGSCSITASQAGDANYAAATPVTQVITVGKRSQTITFTSPGSSAEVGSTDTLSATSDSGLSVSFGASPSNVCTVSGSTVTYKALGTCTLTASQAGNASFAAATDVSYTVTVTKKAQTITFATLTSPKVLGSSASLSATASSGLTVSFSVSPSSVCTLSGTTVSYVAAGTCTVTATQAGNGTWAAAADVAQDVTVTKKAQTISFSTLTSPKVIGTTATLSATASSGLTVSFTVSPSSVCTLSGSTVSYVGAGTCTVTASQAGNATWAAATDEVQDVAVTKKTQTITLTAPSTGAKKGTGTVSATSSSGLSVTITVSGVCSISGSTVTYQNKAGTCTVTATQAGDATWSPASTSADIAVS